MARILSIHADAITGELAAPGGVASALGDHEAGRYVLVRIQDDAGRIGLGEASVTSVWSGETQAGACALIGEVLSPLLVGADPFDAAWLERRMNRAVQGNPFARAAVEMALLDLQGKMLGVPVFQMLGGADRTAAAGIRLKFVIGAVPAADAARQALERVRQGWSALKIKIGWPADAEQDLERVRAVREAVGEQVWIGVDANGAYSAAVAQRLAPRLAALGVRVFEQPTRRGDHRAMAAVRRSGHLPIMADESLFTPQDALEIIRHQAADVLSIYPGKHGGIRTALHLAWLAESAGLVCTIGSNLEREVATAAMAHLATAAPGVACEQYPGDLIGPLYFRQPLTSRPLDYRQDRLLVPGGPGLGVQVGGSGAKVGEPP